jgi:hypothetical protein
MPDDFIKFVDLNPKPIHVPGLWEYAMLDAFRPHVAIVVAALFVAAYFIIKKFLKEPHV